MVWSKERIWNWYNARPWIRGCNYMSADCANRIDQWQAYGFEARLETTEKELALMAETGMNAVRLILEFPVWQQEHDSFLERFDRYLSLCAKYGISVMVTLANDCVRPKEYQDHLGEQTVDWGYHGGRKMSQHGSFAGKVGWHYLDDPELAPQYFAMVQEIVERYKEDERVAIWDVYNEPGNGGRRNVTLPNLQKMFALIREINPTQPLTCAVWSVGASALDQLPEVERFGLGNSDLVSFHCYSGYRTVVCLLRALKKLERPILCTEWLARCTHNTVQEIFPLFYLEQVGCYCWGFVAGKYQTYEPWNSIWNKYEADPTLDFDFTRWFHDLYRPNHRPYDPREIELIRYFANRADQEFTASHA